MLDRVLNADCLEAMAEFADGSFDYGFTSPPHNRKRNDKYLEYDDNIDDYYAFLCNFTVELLRICKHGFFVNMQKNWYNKHDVCRWIGQYADEIQELFIWHKSNPMTRGGLSVTNAYEFFVYFSKKPPRGAHTYTKNVMTTSVNTRMPKEHKAVMKQEVADYYIQNFIPSGSSVIDPFGGVGTTAISCIKHGCPYLLIEKVPLYCEMAEKNIENFKKSY